MILVLAVQLDISTIVVSACVAFSAVAASTIAPILLARQAARAKNAEREADREDRAQDIQAAKEVADRVALAAATAAGAAEKLAAEQAANKVAAKEVARLAALTAEGTTRTLAVLGEKVDVVHTLVNSQLSAAIRSEYDGLLRERTLLLAALDAGPTLAARTVLQESLTRAEIRIAELADIIGDRARQQGIANKQIEAEPSAGIGGVSPE